MVLPARPTQTTDIRPGDLATFRAPGSIEGRRLANVVDYLAEFDMRLSEITPDQLGMFIAARNAAGWVEDLQIPIATQTRNEKGESLAERETDEVLHHTAHDRDLHDSQVPADHMDVGTIGGLEDLPRMFPAQWLWEETQPTLFYKKVADREFLMPVWQRPTAGWCDSYDWTQQRELVEDQATESAWKQHAYVLLDVSRTMNDRDRRGTVARGLALAFLRHGYHARAQLGFRPFTETPGELSTGVGRPGLRRLAERVIELPNAGQTRIQAALEQAAEDIRAAGPCHRADIMLLSDGLSRLTQNPLADAALHTFLIGDLVDRQGEAGTVGQLSEWSRSLHRVWLRRFAGLLAPTWEDVQAAGEVLRMMHRGDDPQALAQVAENFAELVRRWKGTLEAGEEVPAELAALERELAAAQETVRRAARPVPRMKKQRSFGRRLAFSAGGDPLDAWQRRGSRLWAFLRRLILGVGGWMIALLRRSARVVLSPVHALLRRFRA